MKKKLMSVLGWLLIVVCGIIIAALLTNVPVGYSDADVATIGRKYYYGLPFPHYIADGESSMGTWGQVIRLFPFNAAFWSVVVAFLSCIPRRKINWKRIIGVLVTGAVLFGMPFALGWWGDQNVKPMTRSAQTESKKQFPNEEEKKAREAELRNRILKCFEKSNPNNLTADDIDMTGWEEADRKTDEGDFGAMLIFTDTAWKRSNAKKIAPNGCGSAEK